jgi:hypothetical protein
MYLNFSAHLATRVPILKYFEPGFGMLHSAEELIIVRLHTYMSGHAGDVCITDFILKPFRKFHIWNTPAPKLAFAGSIRACNKIGPRQHPSGKNHQDSPGVDNSKCRQ